MRQESEWLFRRRKTKQKSLKVQVVHSPWVETLTPYRSSPDPGLWTHTRWIWAAQTAGPCLQPRYSLVSSSTSLLLPSAVDTGPLGDKVTPTLCCCCHWGTGLYRAADSDTCRSSTVTDGEGESGRLPQCSDPAFERRKKSIPIL